MIFKSHVNHVLPPAPIKFAHSTDPSLSKSLADIAASCSPELAHNYSFFVNPLLYSGHLQTAYTGLNSFEDRDHVHYRRRIITIPKDASYTVNGDSLRYDKFDGTSTFAIDYVSSKDPLSQSDTIPPTQTNATLPLRTHYATDSFEDTIMRDDSRPLVVSLHGLSGGLYELYIRAHAMEASNANLDFVVLNARGCAGHVISLAQLFNGLWTNDLRFLINEHYLKKWPQKRIYLTGFLLGGCILANYLGQEGSSVPPTIKAATIFGAPWDFPQASKILHTSFFGHRIYLPAMCKSLLQLVDQHASSLEENPVIAEFKQNPTDQTLSRLVDFDDALTSRLFGFNNAAEYYMYALPVQRLHKVRVPTLIISSQDDPIAGHTPNAQVSCNPYTLLVTTTVGGHLGWFRALGSRWYPQPVARLLKELDHNWKVDHASVDIPRDLTNWKHDRIVV